MKLCSAKSFARAARRRTLALLAFVLILALPVAGGRWAGLPSAVWREFPPRQVVVAHAAFHWAVFAALAAAIAAALGAVVWRVVRGADRAADADDVDKTQENEHALGPGRAGATVARARPAPSAESSGEDVRKITNPLPVWGWAGLVWTLAAWAAAWTRLPALAPIQHHTYVLVWSGYIVTISALTQRRAGTCLLTRRPATLAGLALVSAAFWWGFEFLNRAVQNWFYQNLEGFTPAEYVWMATLSFMTVLPAVLGTHDWLATHPRLTAGLEDWVRIRFSQPRRAGVGFALAGAAGLFLLPVWPNALFPLLWLAPLALLCGLLAAAGEATLFDALGRGDWRTLVRLALAAVICGFFWEMWNMHSLARWVYDVPYVGRFKIFEMPLLGFAGYGPFGWECAAVAMVFGLWQLPDDHKARREGGAA